MHKIKKNEIVSSSATLASKKDDISEMHQEEGIPMWFEWNKSDWSKILLKENLKTSSKKLSSGESKLWWIHRWEEG